MSYGRRSATGARGWGCHESGLNQFAVSPAGGSHMQLMPRRRPAWRRSHDPNTNIRAGDAAGATAFRVRRGRRKAWRPTIGILTPFRLRGALWRIGSPTRLRDAEYVRRFWRMSPRIQCFRRDSRGQLSIPERPSRRKRLRNIVTDGVLLRHWIRRVPLC